MEIQYHIILFVMGHYLGDVLGDSVEPKDSHLLVEEGLNITLSCSYSSSYTGTLYLYWYRYYLNKAPEYILHKVNKGTYSAAAPFAREKFISEVNLHTTNLTILNVKVVDSATYHCALQTAYNTGKFTFSQGTKLLVRPEINTQEPSVHLIRSKEEPGEAPTSACVATGYPTSDDKTKASVNDEELKLGNQFILQQFENKWIYSTVVWDRLANSTCSVNYNGRNYKPEAPEENSLTCSSVSEINSHFETDTKLNTLSITVLGLRILAVKTGVLNLLITLRLWST